MEKHFEIWIIVELGTACYYDSRLFFYCFVAQASGTTCLYHPCKVVVRNFFCKFFYDMQSIFLELLSGRQKLTIREILLTSEDYKAKVIDKKSIP